MTEERMNGEPLNFSPKQFDFLETPLRRLNILSGSVRSGKTFVSLWKWALWILTQPKDREFIMIGKNLSTLKRNCLNLLESMVGKNNFRWSTSSKTAWLFDRVVHLEGANDERAENKIRGMTLAGAYCDEATLYPESFWVMLLTRLSDGDGCLIATTNPDHPNHYLKTKYIDNKELDIAVWEFYLDDNIFLQPSYIENIKKEFKGVYFQRFILGLWVRAEGLVFETYAENPDAFFISESEIPDDLEFITIGTDFGGNKSKTVFVATGFTKDWKNVIVLADFRVPGEKGTIDANVVNKYYVSFLKDVQQRFGKRVVNGKTVYIPIKYSFADSAEQYLITGMKSAAIAAKVTPPMDSMKKAINDRIFFLNRLIASDRLKIVRGCKVVPESLAGLVWDSDEDKDVLLDIPGETPNDGFDALSYAIERFIPYFEFKGGNG